MGAVFVLGYTDFLARHYVGEVFAGLGEIYQTGLTLTQRAAEFRSRPGEHVTADLTILLDPIADCLVIELQPINRLVRINRDDVLLSEGSDRWHEKFKIR